MINKRSIIIVKFAGGIGNQLFQFFFGLALAKKENAKLIFDLSFYKRAKDRQLLIEKLINIKFKKVSFNFFYFYLHRFSKITYQKEINKNYQNILIKDKYNYFNGYWQNSKYFDGIINPLSVISFKITTNYYNKIYKFIIKNYNNICFIHIRRGDYVNSHKTKNFHGVCSDAYYLNAIKIFLHEIPNLKFLIFSDSIAEIKKIFINIKNCSFIDPKNNINELDELYLMSLCKFGVISNSSFSWWAGYLNFGHLQKKIISPKYWYKNKKMSISINPSLPQWIKLNNFH